MKENNGKRIGIGVKISLLSGIIVLILLAANSGIFLRLESNLIDFIIAENIANEENDFKAQEKTLRKELVARMKVNADICSGISAGFLYNFDPERLQKLLLTYMNLPEISAIKVADVDGNPFSAVWRSPDVQGGEALPEGISLDESQSFSADAVHAEEKVGSVTLYFTDRLLTDQLKTSQAEARKKIDAFSSTIHQRMNKALVGQVLAVICVVLILIATLVISVSRIAIVPIKGITQRLREISEGRGDLTVRLEVKNRDEIGELADYFNRFVRSLQEMLREIAGNANSIGDASSELNNVSDVLSSGAKETLMRSDTVAAAAEEMSSNMTSVAAAMEQASTNVNTVAASAEEMSTTIADIARNSENAGDISGRAVSQADKASKRMEELGVAARDIGKVTEAITDISEQTNLLALNATIEAARAGEAGKGFAVVANEIKALALQTAESTRSIKEQIDNIQNTTEDTSKEIQEITATIDEINNIVSVIATAVEEQSAVTGEIANNVSQASLGMGEVNENVVQSSVASGEISKDIAEVNQAAASMDGNSAQVSTSAESLLSLAEELRNMVGKFKI